MVNRQVVLDTIKKMYDSGIEDSVVKQTLRDIGLADKEIDSYIEEVKGKPPAKEGESGKSREEQKSEAAEIKKQVEEKHAEQEAMHTTTQNALQEQSERLEELKGKLNSCETKLAQASGNGGSEELAGLNQRLGAMEKDLSDLKAQTNALKSVLEKVLETDRKVLNKL